MDDEVLSQRDIDHLVSSFAQGGEGSAGARGDGKPSSRYQPYDFRHPTTHPKAQIASLSLLLENFASVASASLSAYLRMPVHVSRELCEAMEYEEYLRQLPEFSVNHVFTLEPLPGYAMLTQDAGVVLAMMERLLGGADTLVQPRKLTEIESALSYLTTQKLLTAAEQSWHTVVPLKARLRDLVWDVEFLHLAYPGDPVIVATFSTSLGRVSGALRFVVPRSTLEPLTHHLGERARRAAASDTRDQERQQALLHTLQGAQIGVRVELGRATLTTRELHSLRVGDVIVLDTSISAELPVRLEGRLKFLSRPGTLGNRLAVQITRRAPDAVV